MLTIFPVPAFSDNYCWLLYDAQGAAFVVDPGDGAPVLEALRERQLELRGILITHHHGDHVGGIAQLYRPGMLVYGPHNPSITQLNRRLGEGDSVDVLGRTLRVLEVPGHTLDHIAYYAAPAQGDATPLLFCGDTLFSGGCGRLFEGTPETMLASLKKLQTLPDNTQIFCAHEYTVHNLSFAQTVEPANPDIQTRLRRERRKRQQELPTLPSVLSLEKSTNPFLRTAEHSLRAAVEARHGQHMSNEQDVFRILRTWRDHF